MNENQIADIWLLVKEYTDKKVLSALAERYVELLVDHGVSDRLLKESTGHDAVLDDAIDYYLDNSEDEDDTDIEDNWDFDEDE